MAPGTSSAPGPVEPCDEIIDQPVDSGRPGADRVSSTWNPGPGSIGLKRLEPGPVYPQRRGPSTPAA
jgi:hypothetical protein